MEPQCKDIVSMLLPAVRASVAEELHKKYGYTQEAIAAKLGIVQVAVSKYLRGKYSQRIKVIKERIEEQRLDSRVIECILNKRSRAEIDVAVDELCDRLVAVNLVQ